MSLSLKYLTALRAPRMRVVLYAASMLERDDTVIDLRSADEAQLITDKASRLAVTDINQDFTPPSSGRVVFCCRGGQRAWQAAERLSTRWHGPIALIAAGTPQPKDTI